MLNAECRVLNAESDAAACDSAFSISLFSFSAVNCFRIRSMRNWSVFMRWHDLLFMHWPVPANVLRPLIPEALELDLFDGGAWVGVVPFRMSGIRHRLLPPLPGTNAFPELNVRTYVKHRGRAGVWFFSLDAANWLAVRMARMTFHLPYFDARMSCRTEGGGVRYSSERTHRGARPGQFKGRYRPTGPAGHAAQGSIDDFLTHRMSLFSADARGRVYRGDIEHEPWPLRPAEAVVEVNTMTEAIGVRLPDLPPLLHFSDVLDVKAWRLKRVT
jgi:uncharacterized protein YqjF (DUF2071 family)